MSTPPTGDIPTRYLSPAPVWTLRLLLAALFVFGSEVLLWTNPPKHDLADWAIIIAGQIALASVALDVVARYRVRELYGLMVMFVGYAVLAGLLVNPETALADFPNTLISRVIGANATFGLEMFGLLLVLLNSERRHHRWLLLGYSAWLGFYFGVWIRWSPVLGDTPAGPISLEIGLTWAAIPLAAALILFFIAARLIQSDGDYSERDLRLTVAEWGLVAVTLIVLLMARAIQEQVDALPLLATVILTALSYGVLWSQQPERGSSLLDERIPPAPLSPIWIALAMLAFAAMTVTGFELRLLDINTYSQFTVMQALFLLVGFTWLPLAASVISIRAIDRHSRTNRW